MSVPPVTLCAAPPGTDVSASAHRCLDCRGKIHCAMWCSENWGEYIESDCCKITPDQLSAAGRASVQGSDHELKSGSPIIGLEFIPIWGPTYILVELVVIEMRFSSLMT